MSNLNHESKVESQSILQITQTPRMKSLLQGLGEEFAAMNEPCEIRAHVAMVVGSEIGSQSIGILPIPVVNSPAESSQSESIHVAEDELGGKRSPVALVAKHVRELLAAAVKGVGNAAIPGDTIRDLETALIMVRGLEAVGSA